MSTLTTQTFDETGNDLTLTAASSGDNFANTGKEFLIITNNDTAAKTVTVTAQDTSFDDPSFGVSVKQDQSVSVSANGGVAAMGPFPTRAFNDTNNNVQITYSAVTSLEIAVVKQ